MSHFKPGDMALTLTAGLKWPPMTQVALDVFLLKGGKAIEPDGVIWTAPFDGWVTYRDDDDRAEFYRTQDLMPLRGDFTPEQQKSREVPA